MTILVQGMRRSGTTILYDALCADPSLRCFYEPFREDDETPGGGSGARPEDAFGETRAFRDAFRAEHHPELSSSDFNWGGPRNPQLEVGPGLPEHCVGLVRALVASGDDVAIKFTRAYDKLQALSDVAPEAALVHAVRDPRAVATSMVLGRNRRRAGRFGSAAELFAARSTRRLWSSRAISDELLTRPEYAHLRRPTDIERVLVVWRHTFDSTWRDGRRLFGDRYVLIQNERLRADPVHALADVYRTVGRPPPGPVLSWATDAVRAGGEPVHADDGAWVVALARVGLGPSLERAGYGELAAAVHAAPPPDG